MTSFLEKFRFVYGARIWVLFTVLLALGFGLTYDLTFFHKNAFLPAPFLNDVSDTFMDFYNPLHWAYNDHRYDEWKSVYPPLNFLLLKAVTLFSLGGFHLTPIELRGLFEKTIFTIFCAYLMIPIVVLRTESWRIFSNFEKVIIYFMIITSAPMLFALERGNLIIFTPLILCLIFSEVQIIRVISISLLINVKPYFVYLLLFYIATRNWRSLFYCCLTTAGIFFISGILLGGSFISFFNNLIDYQANISKIHSIRELLSLPSSISVFEYALDYIDAHKNSQLVHVFISNNALLLSSVIRSIHFSVITIAILAVSRNLSSLKDWQIFVFIISIVSNSGISVGGYSLIYYVVCIPFFLRMKYGYAYIAFILIIVLPLDIVNIYISKGVVLQISYLGDQKVLADWRLGAGSLLRPVLNFLILIVLWYELFWSCV